MCLPCSRRWVAFGDERDSEGGIGDDECEHAKVLATTRTFVALLSGFGGRDGGRIDRFRAGAKDADLRHRT